MVKDHSDSKRRNPLPPHVLLFPISSKGSFICFIPQTGSHTTAFVTPVVEHWLEQEIAQWLHHEGSIRRLHHERTLLPHTHTHTHTHTLHLPAVFAKIVINSREIIFSTIIESVTSIEHVKTTICFSSNTGH